MDARVGNPTTAGEFYAGRGDRSLEDWRASAPAGSAARVLASLAHHETVLTLPQLAAETRLSLSTVRSAARTLVSRGYARPDRGGLVVTDVGLEAALAAEHLAGEAAGDELDRRDFERWAAEAELRRGLRGRRPPTLGPAGQRARTVVVPHAAGGRADCPACRRGHGLHEHRSHRVDAASYRTDLLGLPFAEQNPHPGLTPRSRDRLETGSNRGFAGEVPDAVERAIGAGAQPPLVYMGSGATAHVFCEDRPGGRAFKVARWTTPFMIESLGREAELLRSAGRSRTLRDQFPRFYGYDRKRGVIVRECVRGELGYGRHPKTHQDMEALAYERFRAMEPELLRKGWTVPEQKPESWAFDSETHERAKLFDAGMSSEVGRRLVTKALRLLKQARAGQPVPADMLSDVMRDLRNEATHWKTPTVSKATARRLLEALAAAGGDPSLARSLNPRRASRSNACNHGHPELARGISARVFHAEFAELWRRSGLRGLPRVTIGGRMDAKHARTERDYAEVDVAGRHFYFASAVLRLPRRNRLGLLSHEIGHVLCPSGSESAADASAARRLGVAVAYDPRWRGRALSDGQRGLQVGFELGWLT